MKRQKLRGEDRACVTCGRSFRWHHCLPTKRFCAKACYSTYTLTEKGRLELFWRNVVKTDTCWLYSTSVKPEGYAFFRVGAGPTYKQWYAHRFSYELHHGAIADGMDVCHRCDVRNCVRPDHLFLGTHDDNMADMIAKDRHTRGERSGRNKLTEAQVLEILANPPTIGRRGKGGGNVKEYADRYGVGIGAICAIVRGETWTHLRLSRQLPQSSRE